MEWGALKATPGYRCTVLIDTVGGVLWNSKFASAVRTIRLSSPFVRGVYAYDRTGEYRREDE